MSETFWEIALPLASGLVTGLAGYIGGRRVREKDIESKTLSNLDGAFTVYKKIVDDLDKRIQSTEDDFNKKIQQMTQHYEQEISKLKERISNQDMYIRELEKKLRLV